MLSTDLWGRYSYSFAPLFNQDEQASKRAVQVLHQPHGSVCLPPASILIGQGMCCTDGYLVAWVPCLSLFNRWESLYRWRTCGSHTAEPRTLALRTLSFSCCPSCLPIWQVKSCWLWRPHYNTSLFFFFFTSEVAVKILKPIAMIFQTAAFMRCSFQMNGNNRKLPSHSILWGHFRFIQYFWELL